MKKLKVRSHSMLSPIQTRGGASSWVYTIHHLMREFERLGHDLHLITTDGIRGVDKRWLKYFRDCSEPDIDINYTLPSNWPHRFSGVLSGTKRAKLRLGIFNYESSILPQGWSDMHRYVDYVLPSSSYCADIFIRAGIPEEKIVVMPLGVDFDALNKPIDLGFEFKTKKKFKLLNISIPHARKNIVGLIDAYFAEFNADDDICLILKTSTAPIKEVFEVDVPAILSALKDKYAEKRLPEIELCDYRFENMATIYKKSDALICTSNSEGWWLPGLEAMYCGNLIASPRYGGQLDFLNHDKNCLLIDTVEGKAPPEMQYWQTHPNASIGYPVMSSMQKTMRKLYQEKDALHERFDDNMKATVKRFTWEAAVKLILDLYDGKVPKKVYGEML